MALKLETPVSPAELIEEYRHGFHDPENYVFKSDKGLTREIVERISAMKDEPDWMREFRLKAYEIFIQQADADVGRHGACSTRSTSPTFTISLSRPTRRSGRGTTCPRTSSGRSIALGSPRPSASFSSGVSAQYESEVVYHNTSKALDEQGVLFCDMDTAVKKYPDIVRKYFATIIPAGRQ